MLKRIRICYLKDRVSFTKIKYMDLRCLWCQMQVAPDRIVIDVIRT